MRGVSENPPAAPSISEAKARAEAERSGLPFLVYRDGDDAQQLFTLDPGLVEASVGRQPSSDLPLRGTRRSRASTPGSSDPGTIGRSSTTACRATAPS